MQDARDSVVRGRVRHIAMLLWNRGAAAVLRCCRAARSISASGWRYGRVRGMHDLSKVLLRSAYIITKRHPRLRSVQSLPELQSSPSAARRRTG